jgi:hypothetical protein
MTRYFTGFDVVGLALAGAGLLAATAAISMQPTFHTMFSDYGQALPTVTVLFLQPWFLGLVGMVPLAVVLDGVLRRASRRGRSLRMKVSILLALAVPVMFLAAMYLPVFASAPAIR